MSAHGMSNLIGEGMTTQQQDLVRRTYDAFMEARRGRVADARVELRALRQEAGEAQWDGIRDIAGFVVMGIGGAVTFLLAVFVAYGLAAVG